MIQYNTVVDGTVYDTCTCTVRGTVGDAILYVR